MSLDVSLDDIEDPEPGFMSLHITLDRDNRNYDLAGEDIPVEKDQINLDLYPHLLNDDVHLALQEVLHDVQLPFVLSDFQLLSLHVIGSCQNFFLVSPTGSGKTMVIYLGILLLRKIMKIRV